MDSTARASWSLFPQTTCGVRSAGTRPSSAFRLLGLWMSALDTTAEQSKRITRTVIHPVACPVGGPIPREHLSAWPEPTSTARPTGQATVIVACERVLLMPCHDHRRQWKPSLSYCSIWLTVVLRACLRRLSHKIAQVCETMRPPASEGPSRHRLSPADARVCILLPRSPGPLHLFQPAQQSSNRRCSLPLWLRVYPHRSPRVFPGGR